MAVAVVARHSPSRYLREIGRYAVILGERQHQQPIVFNSVMMGPYMAPHDVPSRFVVNDSSGVIFTGPGRIYVGFRQFLRHELSHEAGCLTLTLHVAGHNSPVVVSAPVLPLSESPEGDKRVWQVGSQHLRWS